MLAPSVSDMLKILEKLPEWVGFKRLPGRVEELEQRVAALEAKLSAAPQKPAGTPCPICEEGRLKTVSVSDDPTFGIMGVKLHLLKCTACKHTETKQVRP